MHATRTSRPARHGLLTLRKLGAVAAAGLLAGCSMFARPPKDLDYSRTRTSGAGLYRATIRPEGDSIPRGRLQRWTLHLETANGTAVDSALVAVDGGMPQHGHGLPTRPRVTRALGSGDHLVEGMKFNMGGWWVVKFRVRAAAGSDSVVFNLEV
jgi:YtkA-like